MLIGSALYEMVYMKLPQINEVIKAYKNFVARGRKFTVSQDVSVQVAEFAEEIDSVAMFIHEKLREEKGVKIPMNQIYSAYKEFTKESLGMHPLKAPGVTRRIKNIIGKDSITREQIDGVRKVRLVGYTLDIDVGGF